MLSRYRRLIIAFFTLTVLFSACTKVIDINLNVSAPQIIIEGNITNQAGPYQVQITKTVNFSDANVFPKVTGALVIITDITADVKDTLFETFPGIYTTKSIIGSVGHNYQLSVLAEGKTYNSFSTIPQLVELDSITFIKTNLFGKQQINTVVNFNDPPVTVNYYSFDLYVNGVRKERTYLFSDRLADGKNISQDINTDSLEIGNTVKIEMKCIDKGVYNYFKTLPQVTGGNNFQSVSPANPISNISNKALGYFSAHTIQVKEATVK
ncbi:MAG TPA: DUF4249 domain-containing protein [Saprospiraceae bacterium]|nr:DUF4249 domain-containing protein [Saprospiraceae bacterium]